jgi:LysM repeat protein
MLTKALLLSALIAAPTYLHAASVDSQKQEYEQVRKIALRDPKVRAAYAEADRKLEAKILAIDPALASYLRRRPADRATPAAAAAATPVKPKPFAVTTPVYRRSHVVVKGDTLASISVKYGVTVASLKSANHITDERKLGVGQVLAVPNTR